MTPMVCRTIGTVGLVQNFDFKHLEAQFRIIVQLTADMMKCNKLQVTQFVILCWTAVRVRTQLMNNQQMQTSVDQRCAGMTTKQPAETDTTMIFDSTHNTSTSSPNRINPHSSNGNQVDFHFDFAICITCNGSVIISTVCPLGGRVLPVASLAPLFRTCTSKRYLFDTCCGETSYFFYQRPEYPRDCEEVRNHCSSDTSSGVYLIKPDGYPEPFEIYCDNVNSEAWTVILRRNDEGLNFKRSWTEYSDGFGFLSQEFWIGNEKLSFLTNQNYEIRINITYENGSSCYVNYDLFRTTDDFGNFKITKLGQYSGNADNCLPVCDCSCQKTCANPSVCLNTCNTDKSCVCSDGLYLKGKDCVRLAECTRCEVDGVNIPEGESYVNLDCTSRAVCQSGQLVWDNTYTCSANAVCEERNNLRQCYTDDVDCLDVYNKGLTTSDVYTIKPTNWPGSPFQVYCNMTDGGGWTVFQRRVDGTVDFYQNWTSYRDGFGSLDHEHWLGNDKLYYLTNQKRYTIRIDLVNLDDSPYYAKYDYFRINDVNDNFRLSQVGSYSGTADERGSSHSSAGNSFSNHRNYQFSTYDEDHDTNSGNCAESYRGGWWYHNYCYHSNLNGRYVTSSSCSYTYIYWYYLPGNNCNQYVEMKIRPY